LTNQLDIKDMRIFITGGAGFIGANLVKYLIDKGYCDITVYDNLSVGSKKNLDRAISDSKQKSNVKFIQGDVLDTTKLNKVIKGYDAVIHLAAHTRVIESLKNPKENFTINSMGTFNVLEAARKNKVKKFIFASSNAVVGEQIPPINEKMIPKPISPYGASKLYGEGLCSAYYYSYGLRTVSLRFANVYGPYSDHKTSVVAQFIKRAKAGKPLKIYGDGNQTRDFIHTEDICWAIFLNLTKKLPHNFDLFQIGTGEETSVNELLDLIKKEFEKRSYKVKKTIYKPERPGEIKRNYTDISKAKKFLSFRPKINLNEGITKTMNWFC
jgi:UDP-glucose 4-epimerase